MTEIVNVCDFLILFDYVALFLFNTIVVVVVVVEALKPNLK